MKSISKYLRAVLIAVVFFAAGIVVMFKYLYETEETSEDYSYEFANATIVPTFYVSDSHFILKNYTEFANYTGNVYVCSIGGREEGGGFLVDPVEYPNELYIYYVNGSTMYGIAFRTDYKDPIFWQRDPSTNSIDISIVRVRTIFHFEIFILAYTLVVTGVMLGFYEIIQSRKKEKKQRNELLRKKVEEREKKEKEDNADQ